MESFWNDVYQQQRDGRLPPLPLVTFSPCRHLTPPRHMFLKNGFGLWTWQPRGIQFTFWGPHLWSTPWKCAWAPDQRIWTFFQQSTLSLQVRYNQHHTPVLVIFADPVPPLVFPLEPEPNPFSFSALSFLQTVVLTAFPLISKQ